MTTLTALIVTVFIIGYLCIALESVSKVNKAPVALLMFVAVWTLYMICPSQYIPGVAHEQIASTVSGIIERHLGSTATTLFFLMGAMTVVEVVDQNGGFNWVKNVMCTKSKRALLWRIAFMTFFLSAILDNLTTSIVMIMILRKLVSDRNDRIVYASLVIIAANAGGAFSPIGDVTTIMLWNASMISAAGVITELLVPSIAALVIPGLIMQTMLKGNLADADESSNTSVETGDFSDRQRKAVFILGVGGLIFVPIFKTITHLPPFVGVLLVLGLLWTVTEIFYRNLSKEKAGDGMKKRVSRLLSRIDITTILFFLGILMAVACLEEVGVLSMLGSTLNTTFNGNHYIVTGIIGLLSSIVDNVPLVAGCMGMYPVAEIGDFATDGIFWQLLAYCAGVGGSILIIGSAAGVVVMGLEKITFGWYMKHVSWIALAGYLVGMVCYWLIKSFVF